MKVSNNYFLYLIIIAVAFKALIFLFAELPIVYPDSNGYIFLARLISSLDLSGYSGVRTPGYPLIIAACNMNLSIVVIVQMVLGILISLFMFHLTLIFTSKPKIAFVAALTYLFYVPQFNIERSIVNETTATFFLTASIYFCVVYFVRSRLFYQMFFSILLGCFAALVRPILTLLPFCLILLFIIEAFYQKEKLKILVSKTFLLLLLITASLTFWPYLNYKNSKVFTISTLSGLGMTNAVGGFLTAKEDKYSIIRNIYIRHRNIQIAETSSYENTIFRAFDEMQHVAGLDYVPLSMELQKMSRVAIHDYPLAYINHILQGTFRFWYSLSDRNASTLFGIKYLPSVLSRACIMLLNIFFLAGLPLIMLTKKNRNSLSTTQIILFIFIYLFVAGSSVAQAMVEYGTNRYFLPYQPIVSCFAIIFSCTIIKRSLKFK